MNSKTIPFAIIAFFMCWIPAVSSQQSVNAAGGEAQGSGGSMAFSVGQVAYTYNQGATGNSNEGVQQPFIEIMVSTETPFSAISIQLYPNPSAAYTSVEINDIGSVPDLSDFSCQLYTIYGHLLWSDSIEEPLTRLNTSTLTAGMYIVKVNFQNQPIKTFRFIKTE